MAVIGIDDIDDGRYRNPTLTTIAPDRAEIARTAPGLLLDRIGDGGRAARQVVAAHRLEVRRSA